MGRGPDDAHLAPDDVQKLRDLVEREPPQEAADPRDPGRVREDRVVAGDHRPELEELERLPFEPDPLLAKQDRPARGQGDRKSARNARSGARAARGSRPGSRSTARLPEYGPLRFGCDAPVATGALSQRRSAGLGLGAARTRARARRGPRPPSPASRRRTGDRGRTRCPSWIALATSSCVSLAASVSAMSIPAETPAAVITLPSSTTRSATGSAPYSRSSSR